MRELEVVGIGKPIRGEVLSASTGRQVIEHAMRVDTSQKIVEGDGDYGYELEERSNVREHARAHC
jgi:hypothetical protein